MSGNLNIIANDEKAEKRINICFQCNKFNDLGICTECGCFMVAKVKIQNSSCPLGKWN